MHNAVDSRATVSSAQQPTEVESFKQAGGGESTAAEPPAEFPQGRGFSSLAVLPDQGILVRPPVEPTSPDPVWLGTELRAISGLSASSNLDSPKSPGHASLGSRHITLSIPCGEATSSADLFGAPRTPKRRGKDMPPAIDVDAPCLYTSVDLRQWNRATSSPPTSGQPARIPGMGSECNPTSPSDSSAVEKQSVPKSPSNSSNTVQDPTKVQGLKSAVPRLQSIFMRSFTGHFDVDGDGSQLGTDFTRISKANLLSPASRQTVFSKEESTGDAMPSVRSPRSPGRPASVTAQSIASDRSSRRRGHSVLRQRYEYVFLDFDHVLTTVMLGVRCKNFEIPPVEHCTNKEFGGQARVDKIRELFEVWEKTGVYYCIVSNGRFNRIRTCLERVDLLRYVENKIYCVDTEGRSQGRMDKRDKIERILTTSTQTHTPSDVLFIDDSFANLCQAEDVCVVYQPEAGEYGNGLSLVELGHLVDNAKAELLERQPV
eukprot:GEMP01007479.1.p1 GENE.GEMP01007479.1~~GEMP01007479.1.p1  ORF type:complete len:487 (+),score=76.25 GEMP01007479.1:116-1576(+)